MQIIAVLCTLPFALALARVGWLQVVRGEELNRRAESQHVRRVWIPPHRGKIEDRTGIPFAYTMFNYSIVAEPAKVKNPRRTARTLASALETSPKRIEKLLRSKRSEVYLVRKVTPMLERRVDLSSLPGIREHLELKRVYPQGEVAAHVAGTYGRAPDQAVDLFDLASRNLVRRHDDHRLTFRYGS
jgi:cell division protein FtsI/penicillin-binding protein 2